MWFLVQGIPLDGGHWPPVGISPPGQHPDNSLPPGWSGRPDRPGHDLPGGRFERPGHDLPHTPGLRPGHDLPEHASPKVYSAVSEDSIPVHPDKPDPAAPGAWILVALGGGAVGWAWMETPTQEPQPK